METTALNARMTTVYFVNPVGHYENCPIGNKQFFRFIVDSYEIGKSSLYDFVMASAEETTTPNGVGPKLYIRHDIYNDKYEVCRWGINGQWTDVLDTVNDETDAEDALFERVFYSDFANDEQRDITYFLTPEEADVLLIEKYSALWNVYTDVAASILRKQKIVVKLHSIRKEKAQAAWEDRVNALAKTYVDLIEPRNESYKETANRLKIAIGARIESAVFHTAVKMIRFKYSDSQKNQEK